MSIVDATRRTACLFFALSRVISHRPGTLSRASRCPGRESGGAGISVHHRSAAFAEASSSRPCALSVFGIEHEGALPRALPPRFSFNSTTRTLGSPSHSERLPAQIAVWIADLGSARQRLGQPALRIHRTDLRASRISASVRFHRACFPPLFARAFPAAASAAPAPAQAGLSLRPRGAMALPDPAKFDSVFGSGRLSMGT